MSIYSRYKKDPSGFRKLVELLEITPREKREKMIAAGLAEDREYTEKAVALVITFSDIVNLDAPAFAEVLALAPPKIIAMAFSASPPDVKTRVLTLAPRRTQADIEDILEVTYRPAEVGGAQLKLIEYARDLERRGLIPLKRIA